MNKAGRIGTGRTLAIIVATVGLVMGGPAVLSGCASLEDAKVIRADLEQVHASLDERAQDLAAAAAAMDPTDPTKPQADALAASARARAEAVAAGLSRLEAVLAESEAPSDPITQAVDSLSVLLPEPVRLPAVMTSAAIALAWRGSRLKRGLESVALSIETAKRTDEEFRRCFERHVELFRAAQTPTAQRVVRLSRRAPTVA